jgi:hypothetical protein
LDAELPHFSPHDLRSTARSHLSRLGVSIVVAERCLNHSLGGLVAVYDQHDYMQERRRALELWANVLADAEGGRDSNVTALRGFMMGSTRSLPAVRCSRRTRRPLIEDDIPDLLRIICPDPT